jgi:hypothetical protein
MNEPHAAQLNGALAALDTLDDESLCVLVARAQCLLLDHPGSRAGVPQLTVEVVGPQERRLLAAYRRLLPEAQHRALEGIEHLR